MKLFDTTLKTLERSLDVRLARQSVLAGNVANADTPGFQPRELDFYAAMAAAACRAPPSAGRRRGRPGAGHMALERAAPWPRRPEFEVRSPGPAGRARRQRRRPGPDPGGGVRNALHYGASAKAAGKKLAILRYVANDGKG